MFNELLKMVVNVVFLAVIMCLFYKLFRIPVLKHHRQITIMAVVVGFTNYYLKFVIESPSFFLAQVVMNIVLITALRRYPVLYSFALCGIGYLLVSVIDESFTILSTDVIKWTTLDGFVHNTRDYVIAHFCLMALYILVIAVLHKFKLGFSFIVRRFDGRHALKSIWNFLWAALMLIALLIFQISAANLGRNLESYIITAMILILLVSLIIACIENNKILKERPQNENRRQHINRNNHLDS